MTPRADRTSEAYVPPVRGPVPPRAPRHTSSRRFHETMPGFAVTPLVDLPEAARRVGAGRVVVKNEQLRLGLPAYKVLGGSWALHQAVCRKLGIGDAGLTFEALRAAMPSLGEVTLTTATDGNHGRGIAAMAQHLGVRSTIFVPHDMIDERIAAIASHGAEVRRVDGSYDDAVAAAAEGAAAHGWWLCADTAVSDADPAGDFARDVQAGYQTLFDEMVSQLGQLPDLLFVQAGVGALAASAADFLQSRAAPTRLVIVEPVGSACVLASLRQGQPTPVADDFSLMAGLRAQHVSTAAWPLLHAHAAAAVAIDDAWAIDAMRVLDAEGVAAGESGAAGLGGLLALVDHPTVRDALGLDARSIVACINTEGRTDAAAAERVRATA